MANRPVFVVVNNPKLREVVQIDFQFHSGFSDSQRQKSIKSLHEAFYEIYPEMRVLEISSKSESELGIMASAFNLMITTKGGKTFSVESAFQASKVFEIGGPFTDLLDVSSIKAKKDKRLKESGNIIGFKIFEKDFPSEPKTLFYNWLFVNALKMNNELADKLIEYDAFTDIVFNPKKSINCQAEAAAIFVSLYRKNLLDKATNSFNSFIRIVYPHFRFEDESRKPEQISLF